MRLIGYCRQSTQRQFVENQGLERYIADLARYGVPKDDIHWDIESGSSKSRKGLNFVLAEIRAGKFDCLVVPSQDRLTRDVEQWESIVKEFKELGVTIISLDRGELDLETPAGSFSNTVLAAAAAMTRQVNQYNSLQGHRHRRSKNLALRACFGYRMVDGKLILNHDRYKETDLTHYQVARIQIETFLETQNVSTTIRRMCDRFGVERDKKFDKDFHRNEKGLKYWLTNPVLIGNLVYFPKKKDKRTEKQETHESLVTYEEWQQIQSILSRNKITHKSNTLRNPLAGKLFCAGCGSSLKISECGDRRYQKFYYVFCKGAYPFAGKPKVCDRRTCYGLQIKDYIKAVTDKLIERSREVAKWGASGSENVYEESEEIKSLRNKIAQLKAVNDPELSDIIARRETELNQLIKTQYGDRQHNQQIINELLISTSRQDFWESVTPYELRDIFRELVDRVFCDRGTINVTLKF